MLQQTLFDFFKVAQQHRKEHGCAAVPYENGDTLTAFVAATSSKKILEVGTGIGYSAFCLAEGHKDAVIDTIDKDIKHLSIAKDMWEELGVLSRIHALEGKAEGILPNLQPGYDMIFYDGYVPQNKIYNQFEKLLKKGGVLVTANLFLNDSLGGNYLRKLKNERKWTTGVFADTAVSVKLF